MNSGQKLKTIYNLTIKTWSMRVQNLGNFIQNFRNPLSQRIYKNKKHLQILIILEILDIQYLISDDNTFFI